MSKIVKIMNKNGVFSVFLFVFLYFIARNAKKSPSLPSLLTMLNTGLNICKITME